MLSLLLATATTLIEHKMHHTLPSHTVAVPPEAQAYLDDALASAQLLADMPSLADSHAIAAKDTCLSNAFTCQARAEWCGPY